MSGVDDLIAKLANIPDRYRRFDVDAAQALARFGVDVALLDHLCDSGLRHVRTPEGHRFDGTDLLNAAMHLDIASPQRKVLRWWARELGQPYGDRVSYRMDYVVGCPQPSHSGPCDVSLMHPGRRRQRCRPDPGPPRSLSSAYFTLPRVWPELPAAVCDLIEAYADVRFIRLPDALRWDVDFLLATRLADCGTVARLLATEGVRRGMRARVSFGRALAPPLTTAHFWAEFRVDGIWVPVDPVFVDALRDWGILPSDRWRRTASLGGILGRLGARHESVALHAGAPVPVQLRSYRVR